MLTVRELRKALKLFPEDKVVTVFLSILNDNLDYITGIQFDVESWGFFLDIALYFLSRRI